MPSGKDPAEHREIFKKKTNDHANQNKDQFVGGLVDKLDTTSASSKKSQPPLQRLPHHHDALSTRFDKPLKEHNPNKYSYALDNNEPSHLRNEERSHRPDYGRYTRQSKYYDHYRYNIEPHLDSPGQTPDDFDNNIHLHHYRGGGGGPPPYHRGPRGGGPPSHYRGPDFEEYPPPYLGGPGKGPPHHRRPSFDEIPPPYHRGPHHRGPSFGEDPPPYHRRPGGIGPPHHGRPNFEEYPPPHHRGPGGKGPPPHHRGPGFEEHIPPYHVGPGGKGPPHHGRPSFEEDFPPYHKGPPPDHRGPPFHLHHGNPPQWSQPPHSSDNDQSSTSIPETSQTTDEELYDSSTSPQPPPRTNQPDTKKIPDSNNKKPLEPIDSNLPTMASLPDDTSTTNTSTTEEEFALDIRFGVDETEKPQQ